MKKILKEDLVLLEKRIKDLDDQLFALGEEFYEAVNQSSETWHDNAPFDVARDKQTLLQYEKTELKEVLRTTSVCVPRKKISIDIGKIVELHADDILRIFIAGTWTGRSEVNGARAVTCLSPIATLLIGKKVGDEVGLPKGKYRIISVN